MSKEIATKMSPEGLEIANSYLEHGNIPAVCRTLGVSENEVSDALNKREIKQYIDTVFLDTGYRNRFKLSETLDMLIEKKLEEAEETQIYTSKDMADLVQMAHKMRIEEIKAQTEMEKAKAQTVKTQVNIQDNSGLPFGQGNYGELIKKLMKDQ
jgi:16S rRNA G966 N2-methylase RsmD